MKLTYRLSRDDWSKFSRLAQARVIRKAPVWKQLKGSLPVPLIVLPTLATLIMLTASGFVDRRAFGPAFIAYVWGIASFGLADWNARRQLRALWPESGWMLGERRLTVDDDGITSEVTCDSGVTTGQYSWRVIRDVTEQAGFTLLWLSGAEAVIVPARAWADEAARRDFVTLVRERIAQAAAA